MFFLTMVYIRIIMAIGSSTAGPVLVERGLVEVIIILFRMRRTNN